MSSRAKSEFESFNNAMVGERIAIVVVIFENVEDEIEKRTTAGQRKCVKGEIVDD